MIRRLANVLRTIADHLDPPPDVDMSGSIADAHERMRAGLDLKANTFKACLHSSTPGVQRAPPSSDATPYPKRAEPSTLAELMCQSDLTRAEADELLACMTPWTKRLYTPTDNGTGCSLMGGWCPCIEKYAQGHGDVAARKTLYEREPPYA